MFYLTAGKLIGNGMGNCLLVFAGRVIPGLEPFKEKFFATSNNQFEPALELYDQLHLLVGVMIGGIIAISILLDLPAYFSDWKTAIGRSSKRYLVCSLLYFAYSTIVFPLPLWIGQGVGTAIDPNWYSTAELMRRVSTYQQPTPTSSPSPGGTPTTPPGPASEGSTSSNWFTKLVGWAVSLPTSGVTSIFMVLCYLIFFIVIAVICAIWLTFVVVLYVTGPIFITLGLIPGFGEKLLANWGGALVQCALWPVWMGLCTAMVKNSMLTQMQNTLTSGGTETDIIGQSMINVQMVSYCAVFMVLYGMTPVVANMIFPLSSFGQMMGMVAKKATDVATMGAGLAMGAVSGGIGMAPLLGGKAMMGAKAGASLSQQAGSSLASKAMSGLSSMSKSEITGAGSKLDGFDMKGANFGKAADKDFSNLYKKGLSSFEGGGQEYLRDLAEGKTENLPSFEEAIKNGFSPETAKTINEALAANERINGASSVRMFGANPESVPTYSESLKNGYGDNFQQQKIGEIESLENNWNSMSKEERSQAMRALPTYNQALRQQHDARGASNINKNRQILESQGKMPSEDYAVKSTKDGGLMVSTPRSVMSLASDGSVSKESRDAFEKNAGTNAAAKSEVKSGARVLSSVEPGERGSSVGSGNGDDGKRNLTDGNLTSLSVGDRIGSESSALPANSSGSGAENNPAQTFSYPVNSKNELSGGNDKSAGMLPPAAARSFIPNNTNDSQLNSNSGSGGGGGTQGRIMPGVMENSAQDAGSKHLTGMGGAISSGSSSDQQGNGISANRNPLNKDNLWTNISGQQGAKSGEKSNVISTSSAVNQNFDSGGSGGSSNVSGGRASSPINASTGGGGGSLSDTGRQAPPPVERTGGERSGFIMHSPNSRSDESVKDLSPKTGSTLGGSNGNLENTEKKFDGGGGNSAGTPINNSPINSSPINSSSTSNNSSVLGSGTDIAPSSDRNNASEKTPVKTQSIDLDGSGGPQGNPAKKFDGAESAINSDRPSTVSDFAPPSNIIGSSPEKRYENFPVNQNDDFFNKRQNDPKKFDGDTSLSEENKSVVAPANKTIFAANDESYAPSSKELFNDYLAPADKEASQPRTTLSDKGDFSGRTDGGSFGQTEQHQITSFFSPPTNESPAPAVRDAANSGFVEKANLYEGSEPFVFGLNEAENTQQAFTEEKHTISGENTILNRPPQNQSISGDRMLNKDSIPGKSKPIKLLNLNDESPKTNR